MRNYIMYSAILGLFLLLFSGCSSIMINERAISLQDVINLSEAELGPDVIISHIDATRTVFKLTSEEIVMLKDAGVDDDVIAHILEIDIDSERYDWINTSPYDYWGYNSTDYYYPVYNNYYNRFLGYGYYPYSYYYNRSLYTPYNSGLSSYQSPYYVRRTPGLVGRFYEYEPSVPLYGRDFSSRYDSRRNSAEEDNGDSGDNGSQSSESDDNTSQRRGSDNNSESERSGGNRNR